MEKKLENGNIRLYASDWRWSAAIVGISKYLNYYEQEYEVTDDYIEFDANQFDEDKYLYFAEDFFKEFMHHKEVEDFLSNEKFTDEVITKVNEKLKSNTIMKKSFKSIQFDGKNKDEILSIIEENRVQLIKKTYMSGRSLYYNYCNENCIFKTKQSSCRIRGYYVDMGKKGKSVSYMNQKKSFAYNDTNFFDFIPFAFTKTRESFFINNNFTIKQLIHTNKNNLFDTEKTGRNQLFFNIDKSSNYIDYEVEVIKKERENEYFETIFIRKEAIEIFKKLNEKSIEILERPCNIKRSNDSTDRWLNIEKEVTNRILNLLKLDDIIEKLFKSYNNHRYLIYHLIKINNLIYKKGEEMNAKQKRVYAAAKQVQEVLRGKENKIRAYEQRLIGAISLKDYDKVQEILLHLSAFTQVKMDFLIDVFEDFESNKNLIYTFINELGEKKKYNNKESK